MSRLRGVADLCSRMVSDPANRLLKRTDSEGSSSVAEKKSSVVPLFSKRSPLSDFRRAIKQGKGRSSKRKGNRRCPFLFAPAAGAAVSRAPQSATPPLRFSGKLSARQGRTRLRSSCPPLSRCCKNCRPVRANPPAAVRVPQPVGAGNTYKKELLRNATALSSVNLNRTGSKPKFPRRYARSPR